MLVFLSLITTLQHQANLMEGVWKEILRVDRQAPTDNWSLFHRIMRHPTARQSDFGITFVPPQDPNQPWEIHTSWMQDEVMGFLMLLHPTLQSLD